MKPHVEPLGEKRVEIVIQLFFGNDEIVELPFNAHIENAVHAVDILVEVHNVTAVGVDKIRDFSNDAYLIGAVHAKDCRIMSFLFHFFACIVRECQTAYARFEFVILAKLANIIANLNKMAIFVAIYK